MAEFGEDVALGMYTAMVEEADTFLLGIIAKRNPNNKLN